MPRMARVVVPDLPHHVTQRGNRRQAVFLRDEDWSTYLNVLRTACVASGTRIVAYCLMPNHVHFVMVPAHEDGLRAVLADTHRRYTRGINFREGWRGHLWQERFHSFVMDQAYLHAAVPYVENNPVRAGLSAEPAQWPWSSAAEEVSGGGCDLVDWGLRAHLLDLDRDPDSLQAEDTVERIRLHTRTGRPLGSGAFVERLEGMTGRALAPRKPGPKPSNRTRPL